MQESKKARQPITMIPVTSSQIHSIGHDPETNTLQIRFPDRTNGHPGNLYQYANVDAKLFDLFRNAESIGSFFIQRIKRNTHQYPFTRIYEDSAQQAAPHPVVQSAEETMASNANEANGAEDGNDEWKDQTVGDAQNG